MNAPDRVPLPPPLYSASSSSSSTNPSRSSSFQPSVPPYTGCNAQAPAHSGYDTPVRTASSSSSFYDNQVYSLLHSDGYDTKTSFLIRTNVVTYAITHHFFGFNSKGH